MVCVEFTDPLYRFRRIFCALDRTGVRIAGTDSWLDLGCHNGTFLNLVIERYGVSAVGVDDFDPGLKGSEPWEYLQRDLNKDLVLGRRFRIVSALETLEHIIDTDRFLADIRTHHEEDGYLIISTPNINSLRNRLTVPLGHYPAGLEYRNLVHHVRLYNVPALRQHLMEHGYSVEHVSGVSFLPVRFNDLPKYRRVSELLANRLPQLCGNVVVIARKSRRSS